jgi:hypothetical protein
MPTPTTQRYRLKLGNLDASLLKMDWAAGMAWGPDLDRMVKSTRTFAYFGGYAEDDDGTIDLIADGTIVIADNSTLYVQRLPDGTVSTSATLTPETHIPMALCVTLSGELTRVEDLRDLAMATLLNGGPELLQEGSSVNPRTKRINFIGASVEQNMSDDGRVDISIEGTGENAGDPALVPESSPEAEDDEFSAGSLDAKWTWDNQGTSTATFRKSRLILTSQASGNPANNSKRILYQAAPSGSWAIRTRVSSYDSNIFFSGGLFVRRSATAKFVDLIQYIRVGKPTGGWMWAQTFNITHWTSPTAAVTNHFDMGVAEFSARLHFMQIRWDGTTLYFDFSPDNVGYINMLTLTASASNVLGGDPDQIGIASNAPHASTAGVTGFDWFRCYHNANLNQ